ncbi:receptor-like protein kinase [Seminavis robusta]|uniref:Receptor-like protein kinase n=1 Tax=Seminavis robusta TaxID=568900 RepID=A0A9N8EXX7_9STRA|nr:receptor-like protein kinase [Seminavis robusta]|eukprot:Sro2214_g319360.1 receptor-like protein kinase (346) ;mRNA; f:9120-10486
MGGTIPPEISLLRESFESLILTRQLQLKGAIPTEVGMLTKLTELRLLTTNILGTIPTELGLLQSLGMLWITDCHLSGRIPSEVGILGSLSTLVLSMPDLTGSVPSELFQLSGLECVLIDRCYGLNMEYVLQDAIWKMQQLEDLTLRSRILGNKISIPTEIGTMIELTSLRVVDWNLHSTIPNQVGKLEKLVSNQISGTVPPALLELTNLVHLDLGYNQLEGTLSPDFFSQLTKLEVLVINGNHFSGSIPTEVGRLSSLWKLELQNTSVSGTLPTELLLLKGLASLVVTNTSLSGSIPESLWDKMYQKEIKCYGHPPCKSLSVKTNKTVCHGTSLCGCDCGPCQTN